MVRVWILRQQRGSIFLSSSLRYPIQRFSIEGSQASTSWPSEGSSIKLKMSVEHCVNVADQGQPKY